MRGVKPQQIPKILKVNYLYISKGDARKVHKKVKQKAKELKGNIISLFSNVKVETYFLGVREILDISRQEKSYTLQLSFLENYISRGEDNYIVLSSLEDYYKFVTDENGDLRQYIFDSNVRDYQGKVEVNRDIQNCNL